MTSTVNLLMELNGEKCRCRRRKKSGYSLCGICYAKLPQDVKTALWRKIGHGYEEAYQKAVEALDAGK